jgi:hypothetical protein
MTAARAELLAAGFSPAKDTPRWLQVTGQTDGGLTLNVYTVYTPDGDGLRTYDAEIHPYKGKPFAWRLKQQNVLDEFKEERLPERTWMSARAGWIAKIHTRTEESNWVKLFESAVRPALEDCLAHPGEQGKLERCEYSEQERKWICDTW